jgi:hypothetical protein
MSATADPKIVPLSPSDPTQHTARLVESTRLPRPHEPRTYRHPATSISDDTMLTTQIDSAIDESSLPLEPEVVEEPAEPDRRWAMLGAVGRVAAAVGAATFVSLLFVIVIPSLRQQSADTSTAAAIESLKAAMEKSEQAAKLREAQTSSQSQPTVAASDAGPAASQDESDALLRQFMQWQQKPAEAQDRN